MRITTDTKGREETTRLLIGATDENTKVGALFVAEHYLNDKRNKERVADDLPHALVDELSDP